MQRLRLDVRFDGDLSNAPKNAIDLEHAGYDAAWVAEAGNDPFLALALAAEHTERIELGTGVAIALARSPMTLANTAWDLNQYSCGRLLLGLGSQVKAHVEQRYSMPWSRPAARMREFVLAMRAIWDAWSGGEPLAFRGEFYTHTLMPPVFRPHPGRHGGPRVFLAAVGPLMTQVAGEVADGIRVHSFSTERYLREVTLPAIARGRAAGDASRAFEVSCPILYATGHDEQQLLATTAGIRKQFAFYASTSAYRPVLELHGRHELQPRLHAMSRRGEWDAMAAEIDDELLELLAPVGEIDVVAERIVARYAGSADRVSLLQPYGAPPDVDLVTPVADRVRQLLGGI